MFVNVILLINYRLQLKSQSQSHEASVAAE